MTVVAQRDAAADTAVALPAQARRRGCGRIVVVSASVGAGHDGAAGELTRRLGEYGWTVERHDLVDLLPGRLGRAMCRGYGSQLRLAPGSWQSLYGLMERAPRALGWQSVVNAY